MPRLQTRYPWAMSPLILNAPMADFAGGRLAAQVSLSGGFGFIGFSESPSALSEELKLASTIISQNSKFAQHTQNTLPLGIGLLNFLCKLEDYLPVIQEYKPKAVWLFASQTTHGYSEWIEKIREVTGGETEVWVQIGSVMGALQILKEGKPDVIVAQGIDAGGHGFARGAGVISLIPEIRDTFDENGFQGTPILAAGGISEGRGVAAALLLGAEGVVMGTRFLASEECKLPSNYYLETILGGSDGGRYTVKDEVFDNLRQPSIWPKGYDGRGVVNESVKDYDSKIGYEELRVKVKDELETGEKGKQYSVEGRSAVWAGTGIGFVKKVMMAKDIVDEVRNEAVKALESTRSLL